jgi:hypothetical protein
MNGSILAARNVSVKRNFMIPFFRSAPPCFRYDPLKGSFCMRAKKLIQCLFLSMSLLSIGGLGVFMYWADHDSMTSAPPAEPIPRRIRKPIPIQRPATIGRLPDSFSSAAGSPEDAAFDLDRFLEHQKNTVTFSNEQLDTFIEQSRQTPESLLTAYQASLDPSYLRRAVKQHPGDPRVQLAVLMHRSYPEPRRKWLDMFLQSAPKNALAFYLSALDHFEHDNVDAAITDLMEATQRPRFRHDGYDYVLNLLELLKTASRDSLQARLALIADVPLPHLLELKQLSLELSGLMREYRKRGDTSSLNAAAYIGFKLADRLNEGLDASWIAAQRVRIDIERLLCRQYDPGDNPPFLRETIQERLKILELQGKAVDEMEQQMKIRLVTATEAEQEAFLARALNQGQLSAIRWLKP